MSRFRHIIFIIIVILLPSFSEGQTISGPRVNIRDNNIYVSFSIELQEKGVQQIKQGIEKELNFYIDLFRVWKVWPDEFVTGKYFLRTLRSDPIKKEYVATSNDGAVLVEKRFRSFESMLAWTLSVNDLKIANVRELDKAGYFIKVTVESKIRKLPSLIKYFLIFLPENEFKITKNSEIFAVGEGR